MFKLALIAGAIGAGVYFIGKSMQPTGTPSPLSQLSASIKAITDAFKGAPAAYTLDADQHDSEADPVAAREANPARDGLIPYGGISGADGDAAISDGMGVADARSTKPVPELFQTKAQTTMQGGALYGSPFVTSARVTVSKR